MGARVRFYELVNGLPRVEALDHGDSTLALFLEHEFGHTAEVEHAIDDVIVRGKPSAAYYHEVWALEVGPETSEITFEYDDEPTLVPTDELLELVRAWSAFVRASRR